MTGARSAGTGGSSEGLEIHFEEDLVAVFGVRVSWAVVEPGVLRIGDDASGLRLEYELREELLVLKRGGKEARYRRVGTTPEPLPESSAEVPADPFARTFKGDEIALVLRRAATEGYEGQLTLGEDRYPVAAKLKGSRFTGTIGEGESARSFRATLEGDELTLRLDGERHSLRGDPLPPPELEGVFEGEASRYEHPRGYLGFDMPEGWSVAELGDYGMTLNLGLPPLGTPEAVGGLLWGRLEEEDQNRPVAEVIEKHLPTLRQALRDQGLLVRQPDGPIETFRGKDVPGAVVSFRARTVTGIDCRLWCGGIVKRYSWVSVSGVFLPEKEEAYLPRLKRIFVSLEPRPPERNPELEARLVGKTFSSSQYGRVTKSAHHASYTFASGNRVTRRLMSNIISSPGLPGSTTDSERTGRYEVCGDVLFLFFDTGQSAGEVLVEGEQVVGFRVGSAQYR